MPRRVVEKLCTKKFALIFWPLGLAVLTCTCARMAIGLAVLTLVLGWQSLQWNSVFRLTSLISITSNYGPPPPPLSPPLKIYWLVLAMFPRNPKGQKIEKMKSRLKISSENLA